MINFTFITALLCTFNWISVSVCEFHTVEVQPGEEVTLMCSNFTSLHIFVSWFKLDNRQNVSCISSMQSPDANASFFGEFQNGKFDMTSNISTIFLKIKQVDLFDSGLYFCGFNLNDHSVIVSGSYLKVQEVSDGVTKQTTVMFDGVTTLTIVILGALILFLIIVVIYLVVKIRTLPKVHEEGQNPQHSETLQSDALNYAALHFQPKVKINRGRSSEDQLDTNVIYSATR